ncbi:MAG: glutamate--tRNA ligase [Parvibaculales bacterium]
MNRTRFAPSPTGLLHVGNFRTALLNWLYIRSMGGKFLLRIDDTDQSRSKEEYVEGIIRDLKWLGITHDEMTRQSERMENYQKALGTLRKKGLVYACYESAEELERKRKRQLARGKPPIYDRAGLALGDGERSVLEGEGRKPHWRFKLSGKIVKWQDGVRGEQKVDTASLSDPVILREDGQFLYTLPSVVDDIELMVSHIIRGEDHVTNSAAQIEIFEALGAKPPQFAHHALLIGADGEGLSKRIGSLSLKDLHEQGFEPMAVISLIARLGTAEAIEPFHDMEKLIKGFSLDRLSRSAARFDIAELERLNARVLHEMPYAAIAERLKKTGLDEGEAFWKAICGNIEKFSDSEEYVNILKGEGQGMVEDKAFIAAALEHLPPSPWDENIWQRWTKAVAKATGRKGKALFLPLRLALTGKEHGPEMSVLLPLMGEKRVRACLSGGRE